MKKTKLCVLGVGKMGEALLAGMLGARIEPRDIIAFDTSPDQLAAISKKYSVIGASNAAQAVEQCDIVIIAVKPQNISKLYGEIAETLNPDKLVISIVAGIKISFFEDQTPEVPVIRTMPNTPALAKAGMTVLAPGSHAREAHLSEATRIFKAVGKARVMDEKFLDAVTAISGSGPAYFFYLVEAMTEAGMHLGLDYEVAYELASQTLIGAGRLLEGSSYDARSLREAVTSPGGTTAAALKSFDEQEFFMLVQKAVEAAAGRSKELSEQI